MWVPIKNQFNCVEFVGKVVSYCFDNLIDSLKQGGEFLLKSEFRVNGQIHSRTVRVVDETGKALGIYSLAEALSLAAARGLDLVEIAPHAVPPVCRIMDYGKYKYEQAKRQREARKQQKEMVTKEIKMRPNIDEHDLAVRCRQAARFLQDGARVKVTIQFRGREITHAERGRRVLERLIEAVADYGTVSHPPVMDGTVLQVILHPKETTKESIKV